MAEAQSKQPYVWVASFALFYRCMRDGSGKLSDFPQVTQLLSGGAWITIQAIRLQKLLIKSYLEFPNAVPHICFFHHPNLHTRLGVLLSNLF